MSREQCTQNVLALLLDEFSLAYRVVGGWLSGGGTEGPRDAALYTELAVEQLMEEHGDTARALMAAVGRPAQPVEVGAVRRAVDWSAVGEVCFERWVNDEI